MSFLVDDQTHRLEPNPRSLRCDLPDPFRQGQSKSPPDALRSNGLPGCGTTRRQNRDGRQILDAADANWYFHRRRAHR
jgi:hypothetical protein